MVKLQAGDIIRVMAHFCRPAKYKYLVCVCPKKFKYFVISTEAYILAKPAQLSIKKADLACLEHDSFIDTSKLITLSEMETQTVVDADPRCHKGALPIATKNTIKALVSQHGIMPKDQMGIVVANL